ncbi:MAG TPA: phosphatase PAP2 family protein [Methylophilaceae bacterium]
MKEILPNALVVTILTVLCIQFLDLPLSAAIAEYLGTYAPVVNTSNMPDLLLIIVVTLTSLSWGLYFFLVRHHIYDQRTLFCQLTGTALPLSFVIKIILKWLFGRTDTRTWLSDHSQYGFHWFAGSEGSQGFPSGHMLVFTPLFLALWHFYPRFRFSYGIVLFCLIIALIATEYHFLSDVFAGTYIGLVIYLAVTRLVISYNVRRSTNL